MTLDKNKEFFGNVDQTLERVHAEVRDGLALLNRTEKPIVTFFGSHRVQPADADYQHCKTLAFELGKRGYAILSGGGPGIMHAANSGATAAGAPSLAARAELLSNEWVSDPIFTGRLDFRFLFLRKFIMAVKSDALVFYPGGYGTLDELFEYIVLMQTKIYDTVPIICVNKSHWEGLFKWLRERTAKQFLIHSAHDLALLRFLDSHEDILQAITQRPRPPA